MLSNGRLLDDASTSASSGTAGVGGARHQLHDHHQHQHDHHRCGVDELEIARLVDTITPTDAQRRQMPTHEDERRLQAILKRIYNLLKREPNERRRRLSKEVMYRANIIHHAAVFLRWSLNSANGEAPQPVENYTRSMIEELPKLVYSTHYEESRKVALSLGVLEATAEICVMDLEVFGVDCPTPEHRSIRQYVANLLTNLTFNNTSAKRKLCHVPDFVPFIVKVIERCPTLDQHYAALIRNLSWVTEDVEMKGILATTVPALIRSAIRARFATPPDNSTWTAAMHALWNLSSHSKINQKTICDQTGSMEMLASALRVDGSSLSESASGVMKYISQQLAGNGDKYKIVIARLGLLGILVDLLSASSLTTVTNACAALCQLTIRDPDHQMQLVARKQVLVQLNTLRESKIEEIRSKAKLLISHLSATAASVNQLSYSQASTYKMTESLHSTDSYPSARLDSTALSNGGRLLHRRALLADTPLTLFPSGNTRGNVSERCSSLPRRFGSQPSSSEIATRTLPFPSATFTTNASNRATTEFDMDLESPELSPTSSNIATQPNSFDQQTSLNENHGESPLADSVQCTRSTSIQSLTSDLPNTSGWKSQISTTANSNRQSPVSESDLPASPTFYSLQANRSPFSSNNSPPGGNNDSETAMPAEFEQITLTAKGSSGSSLPLPQPACGDLSENQGSSTAIDGKSEEDNDYGSVLPAELLDQSIESAMPKRPHSRQIGERLKVPEDSIDFASGANDDADSLLLSRLIESAMPKKRSPSQGASRRSPTGEQRSGASKRSLTPSGSPRFTALHKTRGNGGESSPNTSTESQRSSNRQASSTSLSGGQLAPPTSRSASRNHRMPPEILSSFGDDDSFLRDSIAAAMPPSTPRSGRSAGIRNAHSPAKNFRAAMTSLSATSSQERRQHEAADASQGPELGSRCSKPFSTVTNHAQTTGEIATLGTRSLFEAMQMSSFVQHPRTLEKIRDASQLKSSTVRDDNMEERISPESGRGVNTAIFGSTSTLSEDTFSRLDDDITVDGDVPQDVQAEILAGNVLIDCVNIGGGRLDDRKNRNRQPALNGPTTTRAKHSIPVLTAKKSQSDERTTDGRPLAIVSRPANNDSSSKKLKCASVSPARSTSSKTSSRSIPTSNRWRQSPREPPPAIPPKPHSLTQMTSSPRNNNFGKKTEKEKTKQPAQSVRIPPFNYKKPPNAPSSEVSNSTPPQVGNGTSENSDSPKNLKKMLVTTV